MIENDLRMGRPNLLARAAAALSVIVLAILICSHRPVAADGFSDWEVQALYGGWFKEPGATSDIQKGIITVQNASAWDWGSSYFFVDFLHSFVNDSGASEAYGEWYPSLSLSALSGQKISAGPINDVSLTLGVNAGHKSSNDANPFVVLPGFTTDIKIPGFNFFTLGTYAYMDRGEVGGQSNGCHATSYQVTPSWAIPFGSGNWKFSFEGFADFIGAHAGCSFQVISQPQLRLDLGNFWNSPGWFFGGTEYQYWHNKYGIEGLDESFPQALLLVKF